MRRQLQSSSVADANGPSPRVGCQIVGLASRLGDDVATSITSPNLSPEAQGDLLPEGSAQTNDAKTCDGLIDGARSLEAHPTAHITSGGFYGMDRPSSSSQILVLGARDQRAECMCIMLFLLLLCKLG